MQRQYLRPLTASVQSQVSANYTSLMMISRDYLSLWYFFYFKRIKKISQIAVVSKSVHKCLAGSACGLRERASSSGLLKHYQTTLGGRKHHVTHTHTHSNVKTIRLTRSLSTPEEIVFFKKKERKETERKSTCCLQRELYIFQTEAISCFIWREVTEIITY